jgi:hypothetical protein
MVRPPPPEGHERRVNPLTLSEGDVGVVLHFDNTIDVLLPAGEEAKPLSPLHQALVGAAIGVVMDDEFRAAAVQTLTVYRDARPGRSGAN